MIGQFGQISKLLKTVAVMWLVGGGFSSRKSEVKNVFVATFCPRDLQNMKHWTPTWFDFAFRASKQQKPEVETEKGDDDGTSASRETAVVPVEDKASDSDTHTRSVGGRSSDTHTHSETQIH